MVYTGLICYPPRVAFGQFGTATYPYGWLTLCPCRADPGRPARAKPFYMKADSVAQMVRWDSSC